MVITAALKTRAHFTVSKQTKKSSKWSMACGVVEQLITALVPLSSVSHGSPPPPQRDSGWELGAWGLGSRTQFPALSLLLQPPLSCRATFPKYKAHFVPLQGPPGTSGMKSQPPSLAFKASGRQGPAHLSSFSSGHCHLQNASGPLHRLSPLSAKPLLPLLSTW